MSRIKDAGASITTKYADRADSDNEKELTMKEKEEAHARERERRRGDLADMSDTPSSDENEDIHKKMKGKSRADKKRILKELEQARQVEIQMHYKMERQQLRHDARMAHQKLGEKDRMDGVAGVMNGTKTTGFGAKMAFKKGENEVPDDFKENGEFCPSNQMAVTVIAADKTAPEDDPEQDPNAIVANTQAANLEAHPQNIQREDVSTVAGGELP